MERRRMVVAWRAVPRSDGIDRLGRAIKLVLTRASAAAADPASAGHRASGRSAGMAMNAQSAEAQS